MIATTRATPGIVSHTEEEEIPAPVSWPYFKTGSAVKASSFAEPVEVPNMWWCASEKPFFAGQILGRRPKPSLWDKLAQLRSMIPAEERRKYPADGARNLDTYLYGSKNLE